MLRKRNVIILLAIQTMNLGVVVFAHFFYSAIFVATIVGALICRLVWHEEITQDQR